MSVKVNVQMEEKYLYDFMVYHNYTHVSGILGVGIGILGVAMGVKGIQSGGIAAGALWLFFAFYFLIVTPLSMKKKAKMQMKTARFLNPLECEFTEEGLIVRQGEEEELSEWYTIVKAVSTSKSVILYSGRMRAFIFPKECMGEQYEEVLKMIHAHMPPAKVKIRGLL